MKKALFILLVFSLNLTSCTLFELEVDNESSEENSEPSEEDSEPTEEDGEPIMFLQKYDMSVWERIDVSPPERKVFMRILRAPNKIFSRWGSVVPSHNCYSIMLFGDFFEISIGSNTEDYLEIQQKNINGPDQDQIFLHIRNDTLIQKGYTGNAHGYYYWTSKWVKSKVNVDSLKLCEITPDDSNPPPPF
ncbi:hypothetical protein QWY87_03995 [Lutimonas halocynthiae]|uniref:hypothetical protein n=1 Tax=Lutimonas halocynthiae TaxID=1446477 RepID=UPI0025B47EE3|nr:hypothetical protein [Lutimonas halocynthiae]MDN3641848.1 hypothetical protein [Lutimonas halocynthiae]